MPAETLTFKANPAQYGFLSATDTEVLLSGGFGSGKSVSVALKFAQRLLVPGSREALVRNTLADLRRTTLVSLLEANGDMPPLMPPGSYTLNKADGTIRVNGGGTGLLVGCDEQSRLGSLNLTGVGIDEAAEIPEAAYMQLRARCRVSVPGLTNQLYAASNPDGPQHYLARRFGLGNNPVPMKGCRAIVAPTDLNASNLPDGYMADLTGVMRERYLLGRWVAAEGQVYDQFDRRIHVRQRTGQQAVKAVAGVDAGVRDAETIVVLLRLPDGTLHVPEVSYATGQTLDQTLEKAHELRQRWAISDFYADPSALRLREHLAHDGLRVHKATNAIADGIKCVSKFLAVDGDGATRLTIDPEASELIAEIEGYTWNEKTGQPRGGNDHALDSLRYACMGLDEPLSSVYIGGSILEEQDEDDTFSDAWHRAGFGDQHDPFTTFTT